MTKKNCIICLILMGLLASVESMAIGFRGIIPLKKYVGVIIDRTPGTIPLTSEVPIFSAFQTPDEIIITSEAVSTTVTVNIYNAAGVVVETVTETVSAGSEFSIDVTNLPTGAYILEIAFDDTIYVGQFEL